MPGRACRPGIDLARAMRDNRHDVTEIGEPGAATIGGYRLEELVGRGGMGEVYKAWDEGLQRHVAIKLLPSGVARDATFRDRLLRESRLAASLDHPNVVPVYDAGEADDRLYLAMRYVDGTDLRALLRARRRARARAALAIAAQVAGALDAAHARGLVHRDVKPSNVLLDAARPLLPGRLRAQRARRGRAEPTDGSLLGTLDYVAPEQIRGDPVDAAADTYSLGCLLFECLTAEPPFPRPSEVATVFAHLDEPPPGQASVARAPPAVDAVLIQGMAKDPAERPASCTALVDGVRAALGLDAAERSPVRRWAIAGTLVVLAAVALATALILTTRDSRSAPPAAGSLVRIDPATRAVTARYDTPGGSGPVAATRGRVWFGAAGTLWRLDPKATEPTSVESVGAVHALVVFGNQVYLARDSEKLLDGVVVPYDASTGSRGEGMSLLACSMVADPVVGLWAAGCPNVQQIRVTPTGPKLRRTVPVPFADPLTSGSLRNCLCSMAIGDGAVWVVGDAADPRLWRIDPAGRVTGTFDMPLMPRSIATTPGAVWLTAPLDDVVVRVDAATGRVTGRSRVGRTPMGIVSTGDAVWVANTLDGTVSRIDAASGNVTDVIEVGAQPLELTAGDGAIWVTADAPA